MKLKKWLTGVLAAAMALSLAACSDGGAESADAGSEDSITLGFAQVGSESEWRTANTDNIKAAAEAAGVTLQFSDAQQKQENQIKAIRSFIASDVDVISFCPIVETGWDTVLQEAKDAGIPVVLVDRGVTADPSLYVTHIFADALKEGANAFNWVDEYMTAEGKTPPCRRRSVPGGDSGGHGRLLRGRRPPAGIHRCHGRIPQQRQVQRHLFPDR